MPVHGCPGIRLSPEKYGKEIPTLPTGSLSEPISATFGTAFVAANSLSVVLLRISEQSSLIPAPMTNEFRIKIVLPAGVCDNAS